MWEASDSGSGIDLLASDFSPDTVSTEGENQSVSAYVVDNAGNRTDLTVDEISVDYNLDGIVDASDNDLITPNRQDWYNGDYGKIYE